MKARCVREQLSPPFFLSLPVTQCTTTPTTMHAPRLHLHPLIQSTRLRHRLPSSTQSARPQPRQDLLIPTRGRRSPTEDRASMSNTPQASPLAPPMRMARMMTLLMCSHDQVKGTSSTRRVQDAPSIHTVPPQRLSGSLQGTRRSPHASSRPTVCPVHHLRNHHTSMATGPPSSLPVIFSRQVQWT